MVLCLLLCHAQGNQDTAKAKTGRSNLTTTVKMAKLRSALVEKRALTIKMKALLPTKSNETATKRHVKVKLAQDNTACDKPAFSNCELIFKWNFLYLKVIASIGKAISKLLTKYPSVVAKVPDVYVLIVAHLFCENNLPAVIELMITFLGVDSKNCKEIQGFHAISM